MPTRGAASATACISAARRSRRVRCPGWTPLFFGVDEELRALRAGLPARHLPLELRDALGLAIAHARLRTAPLGLEPGALAARSRGPPDGQVRGVKTLSPQQGADLTQLPATLGFAQDLLLVLGRKPAPASLRRHFRIVGLHGERHRTLRHHPLQRTQSTWMSHRCWRGGLLETQRRLGCTHRDCGGTLRRGPIPEPDTRRALRRRLPPPPE